MDLKHARCTCPDHPPEPERCKHASAVAYVQAKTTGDLRIDYPLEEELLAACEYALSWFGAWEEHAPTVSAPSVESTLS